MRKLFSAIACNLDTNILSASLPLFIAEKVEAIEWSFDTLFDQDEIPAWFTELLRTFSDEGRLIGHGVFFSLFSGKWSNEQHEWLAQLKKLAAQFKFDHVTEHFGFMTGEDFHKGAPIGIPFTSSTLAIGIDRLKRIHDAGNCPVGLENLAFAYSLEEVKKHGDFLSQLVEPVNGFIILDLHNVYCQVQNFEISFDEIIKFYPLDRVREIHISGGSWEAVRSNPEKKIRRDTHDESVPREVFELLKKSIPLCPNLKFIVLEQISSGLETEQSRLLFQSDFNKMNEIVQSYQPTPSPIYNLFIPAKPFNVVAIPLEDTVLHAQQQQLSSILETAAGTEEALMLLTKSSLADSAWEIEKWNPMMLETAIAIAQKWKNGF